MFTAPLFSAFCAISTYLFMKEASPGVCTAQGVYCRCCITRSSSSAAAAQSLWLPDGQLHNHCGCPTGAAPVLAHAHAPPARPPPRRVQVRGQGAGLASAAIIAVVPSYISRSVAGSYDLEAVAIFALVFVFYLYVKVRVCVLFDCQLLLPPLTVHRALLQLASLERRPLVLPPRPAVQTLNTGSLAWATALFFGYLYMVSTAGAQQGRSRGAAQGKWGAAAQGEFDSRSSSSW